MLHRSLRDQRGLTLGEILVAIAIIGVALVALASVIPITSYGIQQGNQVSTATFLAEQRIEQVKNANWTATPADDDLGFSASNTTAPASGGTTTFADENPVAGYTGYRREVRIFDCTVALCGVATTTMRHVTVSVYYTPLTGTGVATAEQGLSLTTVVAQR
jgi:prepilin-type N-terminal cleavage/methylation domain-containing protein